MEVVRYNKSIPAPGDYLVPSTLDNKGISLRPRLVDTSLKHLKDVDFHLVRFLGQELIHFPLQLVMDKKIPFNQSLV